MTLAVKPWSFGLLSLGRRNGKARNREPKIMRSFSAGGVPRWDQVTAGSGETARSEGHAWRIAREKSAFSASAYSCSQGSLLAGRKKTGSACQPLAQLRKKSSPGFEKG